MNPTEMVRSSWDRLSKLPAGKRIFSALVGKMIPYTGSISPMVLELETGRSKVQLNDKRPNRNHLDSLHALALANVAEFSTGLALSYSLPADYRFILKEMQITYHKKARGPQTSECILPEIKVGESSMDVWLDATLTDASGEVTARGKLCWRVGKHHKSGKKG